MKKLIALLVAVSVGSFAYACGGMTHVTSPSMQVTTQEEGCSGVESVVNHLQPIVVMA
jgi:hypothetical protein